MELLAMPTARWLLVTIAAMAGSALAAADPGLVTTAPAATQTAAQVAEQWEKIYGPVNFSDEEFYDRVVYVNPEPAGAFKTFGDKKIAPGAWNVSAYWKKKFFKPASGLACDRIPVAYYLRTDVEPSLFLYRWETSFATFRMMESGNGVLLEITPDHHTVGTPITSHELANLLLRVLNLQTNNSDEVIKSFHLSEKLVPGTTFTNAGGAHDHVLTMGDWKSLIQGFISQDSICILLYKSTENRQQATEFDPEWVNRCLLNSDGKTMVAPPKTTTMPATHSLIR